MKGGKFINFVFAMVLTWTLFLVPARAVSAVETASLWNQDWEFHLGDADLNSPDDGWEKVSLPHTPRIEQPMEASDYFQGPCWYHKHFRAEPSWGGKKIMLRFDGAMQIAAVWLNARPLAV